MPTDRTPADEPEGLAEVHLDPITIEVMGNALISIPDEMLAALITSAYSRHIKERQDCSTAIIAANGQLFDRPPERIAPCRPHSETASTHKNQAQAHSTQLY